jgi:hypothetical protein
VLYKKPSASFISKDHLVAATPLPEPPTSPVGGQDDDRLLAAEEDGPAAVKVGGGGGGASSGGSGGGGGGGGGGGAPSRPPPPAPEVDLLGEDLLGLGFGSSAPSAPAPPPAAALVPGPVLDSAGFQARWGALPVATSLALQASRLPASATEVEAWARAAHLPTIASGDTGPALKWFFFGRDTGGAFHLLEAVLEKATGRVAVTVKSEPGGAAAAAVAALRAAFANLPAQ